MKNKVLIGGLFAVLLAVAACSSPGTANISNTTNKTTTTNTTTSTTTTTNTASNANSSNTANTSASNSANNSTSSSDAKQDFTLVNQTGVEIDKVYISPHDSNDWEEDILGQDTLPSGQSVDIKFHRNEKAAMWDLRIEDKSGNSIEWENLNLLEISKLTLHYKDGKATAEME